MGIVNELRCTNCLPSILLILVSVELGLCVVVTRSQNVVLCFLDSSYLSMGLFVIFMHTP